MILNIIFVLVMVFSTYIQFMGTFKYAECLGKDDAETVKNLRSCVLVAMFGQLIATVAMFIRLLVG